MDQLQFDPANTTNTDSTMQVEGIEDQVEQIQNAYPEVDWRPPAEIEAEQQAQTEQQAPIEGEVTEQAEAVTPEVVEEKPETYGPNRFQENPNTGFVNVQEVLATGIDPELARRAKVHLQYDDEERQPFKEYHEAGGDINLEATLKLVNTLRGSERLTAKFDRNEDGEIGFSDWFDTSRMGPISPERERELTDQWLTSLEKVY